MKKLVVFLFLFMLCSCPPFPKERGLKIISHKQLISDNVLNVNIKALVFIQNYRSFLAELYLKNLSDKRITIENYDFKLNTGSTDFKLEKVLGYKSVKESPFNGGYDVNNYTQRKKIIYIPPNDSLIIQVYFEKNNKKYLTNKTFDLISDTLIFRLFLNKNEYEYKLMAERKTNVN
ncbi:MAG: hypothetical protein KKC03_02235 [Bacteroidetes bacterium]|nr:hypothetical protein [Bacteroidota bacterium]